MAGYGDREDSDAGKIFLGGLSWETTDEDLRDAFEKYGKISDATVKTDPSTGRSKGFGFVVFSDPAAVEDVLAKGTFNIGGRTIDPQKANGRSRAGGSGGRGGIKKVFVGGVDPSVSESEIRDYFNTYGDIEDIHMPVDRETNERRPFVFVTFESVNAAEDACDERNHSLGGKDITVRKATPKGDSGGFGGRGGGYGGGRGDSRSSGGRSGGYGGRGYESNGGGGGYDSRRSGGGRSSGDRDSGSRYKPYGRY